MQHAPRTENWKFPSGNPKTIFYCSWIDFRFHSAFQPSLPEFEIGASVFRTFTFDSGIAHAFRSPWTCQWTFGYPRRQEVRSTLRRIQEFSVRRSKTTRSETCSSYPAQIRLCCFVVLAAQRRIFVDEVDASAASSAGTTTA